MFSSFLKHFRRCSSDDMGKIELLAKAREESVEKTYSRYKDKIKSIPRSFNKHTAKLLRYDISEAGVRDGLPFVILPNGRFFYGNFSNNKARREYEFLKDRVSPVLNSDTYLTALDVSSRLPLYPKELLPGPGGVIVEAGAYLGHKTIRFVDMIVGLDGKVLAIEMMPENINILRRNITENKLENCIDVIGCGVWNKKGETTLMGKSRQRNSLVRLDELTPDITITVPTDSLDNILQAWGDYVVDFLAITVNGAEIEALQGLDKTLHRVKVIFVAAGRYNRSGQDTYAACLEILRQRDCVILPQSNANSIYAVTKKYAKNYSA